MNVKVEPVPLSELVSRINTGNYDLLLLGWMGDTGKPDNFWRPLLGSEDGKPGALNSARFHNEDVMALMDRAAVETDQELRKGLYLELEKKVFGEHRPMVPLVTTKRFAVLRTILKGMKFDASGRIHFHEAWVR